MGQVLDLGFDGTLPKKLLWVLVAGWVAWSQMNPAVWVFWGLYVYQTWRTWEQYKEIRAYDKLSGGMNKAVKRAGR